MSNKKLGFLFYLSIIVSIFIISIPALSESNYSVEYWDILTTKDRFKEWNIEFSHPVNPYAINYGYILLTDEDGTIYDGSDIKISLKNDHTILIKPNFILGYDRNKMYYIHLEPTLHSTEGQDLNKEYIIPFIVETDYEDDLTLSDISTGDSLDKLIGILGEPDRIDLSGKDYNWYIYNQDYNNYMQIGIYENKVISIYSARESLLPDYGINRGMRMEEVEDILSNERKYENGYENVYKYVKGDNIITFYYDFFKDNELIGIWIEDLDYSLYPDLTDEVMSDFEKQVFDLANVARAQNGLKPYLWNEEAANTARKHSDDMAKHGYTGHYDIMGRGPKERAEDDNLDFRNLAENVAGGYPSAIEVHHGWMESEGHRNNILTFLKELGVGSALSSYNDYFGYRPYYTQLFITPSHYEFEDDEFVDDEFDFPISEEERKESLIYDYSIESDMDCPGIIDILGLELVFFKDIYNFNIRLRDIPEELIINSNDIEYLETEYRWAVILEDDNNEYMFLCENIKLADEEELVPIKNLKKYLQYGIYMRKKGDRDYNPSSGLLEIRFDSNSNTLMFEGIAPYQLESHNIRTIKVIGINNLKEKIATF